MIANPNDGNSPRVEVATPIIDVSAEGLITATTEQEAGYVPGGSKSATQQLTTQGAKTVTPGTAAQTAVASGRYTTGDVDVAGDANLVPENIAEGVSIFGVQGTHSGGGQLYSVTSDGVNIFFPQLAVAGQFVTTVSGTYQAEFVPIYDITMTYILGRAHIAEFDSLPPQVQEIINQYNAKDAPITRAPPPIMSGYLYFIMPQQDVVVTS